MSDPQQPVRIAFERKVIELAIDRILPVRPMTPRITASKRYARIRTSIATVGIIEPLVVAAHDRSGRHMLLDGHLRLHAISQHGGETVSCLVSDDDEAYTYNKRVSRLATVQEHYMITRALDRGVRADMIAAALGLDEAAIQRRRTMLDGISPEAVEILKDRTVNPQVFDTLRKMRPHKQFLAAEMMVAMNNFTGTYARAMLAATRQEDLAKPDKPKKIAGISSEQMARMERELETLNRDFRAMETTFGDDVLQLVLSSRYLHRLIANPNVAAYLEARHPDLIAEFRTIVSATSLDTNSA
jgi:hypothetical protein